MAQKYTVLGKNKRKQAKAEWFNKKYGVKENLENINIPGMRKKIKEIVREKTCYLCIV